MKKQEMNQILDREIPFVLQTMSCHLPQDDHLMARIQLDIQQRREKEMNRKKIFNKNKIVALATCAVLLIGGISLGAGKIVRIISSTDTRNTYVGMMPEEVMKKELGSVPKYVTAFTNGYAVEESYLAQAKAMDENGAEAGTFNDFYVKYKNAEDQDLTLNITPSADPITVEKTQTDQVPLTYRNISLDYRKDPYKFVPQNYEPTDAEKQAVNEGRLFLSYGTDEIITSETSFLSWRDGDMQYCLFTDEDLSRKELVEMAKQIIDAK